MSLAVDVARAALLEAGRADLAVRVNENRGGWPSIAHLERDRPTVVRAFWLGHITTHPNARIFHDNETDGPAIECDECFGRSDPARPAAHKEHNNKEGV